MRIRLLTIAVLTTVSLAASVHAQQQPPQPQRIRLLARGDDMGAAHAFNDGCIKAYKDGIVRSVEVIVPGPWFPDAVRQLKDNPDLDVGVHLTLTSEWDNAKWRPIIHAPSLVDADGYFHAKTVTLTGANPKPDEVERELRAQIETAIRHLGAKRVSHVSAHMNAATATPQLKAITDKLAKEFKLRTDEGLKRAPSFGDKTFASDRREKALMAVLEKLEPGDWLMVEQPGFDTPETLALGHEGYDNVASDRSNVRRAFTSDRVLKIVKSRNIELISYKDLK